ncbi:MAG: hypothetical protein ISR59_08165 [Anaerolineales bacterium]|uniref:DUF5667 domain-containing protein n=1 Tax=Candidatus Desulfolinea nitratireducens TaxID=2841698 RepID=A0A8J6NLT8_9CHLR|nr:hypothetical protein [Candidatus Desulfolinea nitratireducens]MBL6961072.1 hypothetical protein [Anaerolineales bacterium]
MKHDFDSILDLCIERMAAGESLDACLADYPEHANELEALLKITQSLYTLPPLNSAESAAQAGLQAMVDKVDEAPLVLPFFLRTKTRFTSFFEGISKTIFFSKENLMLRRPLFATFLVLIALFAGTTMTAAAAQDALPGDALYAVKTSVEDLRLSMSWDTAAEAEQSLLLANQRLEEINELLAQNRYEEVAVGVERFQHHLSDALDALETLQKSDPAAAQQLANLIASQLGQQSAFIGQILVNNPNFDLSALQASLTTGSSQLDDNANSNDDSSNDNTGDDNVNSNDNSDDDNANSNDNSDDDNANSNDDDSINDNSDDDNANNNDDDSSNDNSDDDNANSNDDDSSNDNSDDDSGNDNSDDDDSSNDNTSNDNANSNDDDSSNDNSGDDNVNSNDDDSSNNNSDDDNSGSSNSGSGGGSDDSSDDDDKADDDKSDDD